MKKINSIYIIALILSIALYSLYSRIQTESVLFYGFAENKETEISHNEDVLIDSILVTTGQKVKKGELLMTVKNAKLPTKIAELELEQQVIMVNSIKDIELIKNKISDLRFNKANKINEISAKINFLQKEIELNKSLFEGLKSIKKRNDNIKSSKDLELDYLVQSMNTIADDYDREILVYKKSLHNITYPHKLKKELNNTQITHYKAEQKKLSIYAPSDGLIGTIQCKEKENIAAFTTLLNFYQVNPTLVKGFVHESLLLEVEVGNELEVSSSMHSEHKLTGKVIGLGTRIVEIPERLRKMPEIKSFGREVMIEISSNNKFLQKEKVMLNSINSH